jgi:hypothetical protein
VEQHKLAVGGQAAVRLEAVEWLLECAVERRERRVRAVGAAERWAYSAGSTPSTLATRARVLVTSLQRSCEEVVENARPGAF